MVADGKKELEEEKVVGSRARSNTPSESDSDDEQDEGAKNEGELEEDEAEALKKDLGQDIRVGKRVRQVNEASKEEKSSVQKSEGLSTQSEQEWKKLKTQGDDTPKASEEKEEAMILVQRTYRFAGEQVNEEKLLPASHRDAIAYLASKKSATSHQPTENVQTASAKSLPAGPRKKKSSLAAMSAAAAGGKPTKINTLEKSKMDWNKFKEQTADEREKEEMEAQTKGGGSGVGSMKGYLERQNFLDRVQDRLGEQKKS